ncbi:MAG: nucleotidyl transferase AbiEii/AbiGii toxin family protein [Bacteroidales bacterium]|nr:nucleotidyl transferase AbiEii/AbiGii toxin family protein [Bacteroidales bacterium]
MLYKQTTTPFLFETLENLMQWQELQNFRLVGGTGLSLQLGHRQSIDIDLFTDVEFNIQDLARMIKKRIPESEIRILSFGLTIYISTSKSMNLKIDLMETDKYIRPEIIIEGIRFAHIEDIAAMKLEAITSRNTKKDFYDIAELLNHYTIDQLFSFYVERYPYNDIKQVLENFTFFSEDCELEFEPYSLNNTDWLSVKFLLIDSFNDYVNRQLKG